MQNSHFLGRIGTFAAASFIAGLIGQEAKAITFATFSQAVVGGNNPAIAINYELLPSGQFRNTDTVNGNQVVLNWLAGVQSGVSQPAYLYVDGQLIGAPVLGSGGGTFGVDPLSQPFRSLHLQFWTLPGGAATIGNVLLLDADSGDGGVVSASPYNSIGGNSSGSIVFSSGVPAIQNDLNTIFSEEKAASFSLTSLLPSLSLGGGGQIDPFTANAVGSFAAVPEPTTLSLALCGIVGLLGLRRRS